LAYVAYSIELQLIKKTIKIINLKETIPYHGQIGYTRDEIYSQNTSSYLFLGKFA